MPDAATVHEQNTDNVNREETDNIPSVYVDKQLLDQENGSTANLVVSYKVNDSVFYEDDSTDDKIVEFEVYRKGVNENIFKMDNDYDMYCSTPTDTESECEDQAPDRTLEVSLQPVPHGYLINSTVYLTEHQWNTLILLDVRLVKCAACDMYSELDKCPGHVSTNCHQRNLALFKPLEKFDLSITRKIRNKYHCAVCNLLFDIKNEQDHYDSKMHGGNLLFAINKASDIIYDCAHKENNNNVDKHDDRSINNDRNKNNDCYHFNAHAINNDNNSIVSDNYFNFVPNNDDFIDFKHNDENDYDYYEESEVAMPTGMSYATMAKKPKVVIQKFLDIDLGNKVVTVGFDSWNMVRNGAKSNRNTFYCMACKKYDHIRVKAEHCSEVEHLTNLDKYKVVEAYEEYFIRQLDNRLYHCGHCNNLQLIHEMEDHVETTHPRKRMNAVAIKNQPKIVSPAKDSSNDMDKPVTDNHSEPTTPIRNMNKDCPTPVKNNGLSTVAQNNDSRAKHKDATTIPNAINAINIQVPTNSANENRNNNSRSISNDTRSINNDTRSINNDTRSVNNDNGNQNAGIFDNIVIYPFGNKMSIPMLSYNIVCQRPNDFYCGLCDVICPEHLITRHLCDLPHVQLFKRTPFITPFNCNLIRAIRDALHCAICNIPITADQIYIHIRDPQHVMSLSKALGIAPINIPAPNALIPPEAAQIINPAPHDLTAPKAAKINALTAPKAANINALTAPKAANINALTPPKAAPKINPTPNALTAPKAAPKPNPATNALTPPKTAHIPVKNVLTEATITSYAVRIPANTLEVQIAPNIATQVSVPARGVVNDVKRETNNVKVNDTNDNETNIAIYKTTKEAEISEESTKNNKKIERKIGNEVDYEEIENLDDTFDSVVSEDDTFDIEEYVYLKLMNSYLKIANTSYNSLVPVGDGSRYCFVCALQVEFAKLQKHVDSRPHLENMEKYRFLDKYEDHLLRQIFLMYHCCICNVIITRRELKTHLEWPTHALQNENTQKTIKKTRKSEIKGGVKQIIVSTQKENIYLNEKEPKIKILFNIKVAPTINNPKIHTDYPNNQIDTKKNKIIIFNDNVFKITWESWHGVFKCKNGYKCNLCQRDLKTMEIETHCISEWHGYGLDKPFEKQYAPALIRKINESTLNCLICNTEVSNKEHIVSEHINGKKHMKNYDAILKDSSQANTYTDCNEEVLML